LAVRSARMPSQNAWVLPSFGLLRHPGYFAEYEVNRQRGPGDGL
jgi:hypothetical protein